MTLNLPQGGF